MGASDGDGTDADILRRNSMAAMVKFVDGVLERIQKYWTLGGRSSSSSSLVELVPPELIGVAAQTEVAPAGDETWVSVTFLKQSIVDTPVPQNGPKQFYEDCILPQDVLSALGSATVASKKFVQRLEGHFHSILSGEKGKFGHAGGMSDTVEGVSNQRLKVLMETKYDSVLDVVTDRKRSLRQGKAAVWNGHNRPNSEEDIKDMVATAQSGASSVFRAEMMNHSISLASTADAPDVGHFVEQFAAIIEHYIPGGARKKERVMYCIIWLFLTRNRFA